MYSGDLRLLRCHWFLLDDLLALYWDSLSEYGSQLLWRCLSGFDLLPGRGSGLEYKGDSDEYGTLLLGHRDIVIGRVRIIITLR